MNKLYSVLVTTDGAHLVEYNIVNETTGSYHIHGVNGKRVVRKDDIGKLESVSDNSFRIMCFYADVENAIELGYNKLVQVLDERVHRTESLLNQMRSDHSNRTLTLVDLDGNDHTMNFNDRFPE